jgi:hypothetical protein
MSFSVPGSSVLAPSPVSSAMPLQTTVYLLQRAFEHVTENLHVTVWMRAEALSGRDPVIVDDA